MVCNVASSVKIIDDTSVVSCVPLTTRPDVQVTVVYSTASTLSDFTVVRNIGEEEIELFPERPIGDGDVQVTVFGVGRSLPCYVGRVY